MDSKIIGVGFQKTGTSSLRKALTILGYSVKDNTPRALIPILKGNFKKIRRVLMDYDAMVDTPWNMIYKELDSLYPASKFILTIRDEESWYDSVSKHIDDLRAAQHEWIYGRGKGLPKDDKENAINIYSAHNKAVIEYFEGRETDLLIMDFTSGDGWEKLSPFLNREIPDIEIPHANKTSELETIKDSSHYARRIRRQRLKNRFKIFWINLLRL